ALPRGVLMRGQVVEAPSGKPLAWARVDFWSREYKMVQNFKVSLRPEGVFHPWPLRTDPQGRFEVIVPPGRCYLLINARERAYAFTRIAAEELGVEREDSDLFLPPGSRTGKKHYYYPDELLTLDHKPGTRTPLVTVTLRRAPVLKGRVLGPDGKPAARVTLVQGQQPFRE